jgi:1-acylglycerone phosphate reductase
MPIFRTAVSSKHFALVPITHAVELMTNNLGALAGSKRALEILMETLRVELKPFGVNVLSVVTGVVRSNAQNWKHFEDWKLPDDSIYKSLESQIHERIQEKDGVYNDGAVRADTMQHARKLADKILAGTTGTIWIGGQAAAVRFATTYLPQFVLVEFYPFSFKLLIAH